jgi:branched-chain amino acid transport system substrate-binding protein
MVRLGEQLVARIARHRPEATSPDLRPIAILDSVKWFGAFLILVLIAVAAFGVLRLTERQANVVPVRKVSQPIVETAMRTVPTAPPVVPSGPTIRLGAVFPLTGPLKPWGDEGRAACQLAVDEFNAAGGLDGKKVELMVADSASRAEQAKSAAEKLLSQGVIGLIGEISSGNTIQVAKAAFSYSVPLIATGATKTELTDEGAHVFRVCFTDDFQGPVMATFAFEELGLRRISLMTDNMAPYSQGLSKAFRDTFTKLGGEIVSETFYETGQNDFTSQITEVKAKQPDGMFLSGYFPEVGPMAQQIRSSGMSDVKLLGGDGWDSPQLLTAGGTAILGGFMCSATSNNDTRDETQAFLAKWKKANRGSLPATNSAALGYDAMGVMLDALKRCGGSDSVKLMEAIDGTERFPGATGDITLRGLGGNPSKRALVVEVRPLLEGFGVFRKSYEPKDLKK